MSIQNVTNSNSKPNYIIGQTYNGQNVFLFKPSLQNDYNTFSLSPPSGNLAGLTPRIDIPLSNDNFNIDEQFLEFTITNNDSTSNITIFNPYALLYQYKYKLNQQQVVFHQDAESLFNAVSQATRSMSSDELYAWLQSLGLGANFSGITINASGGTANFSLPLSLLTNGSNKSISRQDGVQYITHEFSFVPNYGTAAGNNRFCASSTTSNIWNTNIAVSNLQIRFSYTKHSDLVLRSVSSPVMVIKNYFVKSIPLTSWASSSPAIRTQTNTDFPNFGYMSKLIAYVWNTGGNTAYNYSNACQLSNSTAASLGVDVLFRSNYVLQYTTSGTVNQREIYLRRAFFEQYGRQMDSNLLSNANNRNLLWNPVVEVKFLHIDQDGSADKVILNGIPSSENVVVDLYNLGSTVTGTMFIVMEYISVAQLDPKSGNLKFILQ